MLPEQPTKPQTDHETRPHRRRTRHPVCSHRRIRAVRNAVRAIKTCPGAIGGFAGGTHKHAGTTNPRLGTSTYERGKYARLLAMNISAKGTWLSPYFHRCYSGGPVL